MQSKSHYRLAAENSEMWDRLINSAEKIMQEEGIASLTVGRLAKEFDLKRPTIHYYIGTIEDLIINVIKARSERIADNIAQALEISDPLSVIWDLGSSTSHMATELSALAMRKPNILHEVNRYIEYFQYLLTGILEKHLQDMAVTPKLPPQIIVSIIQSLSHGLSLKKALGVSHGIIEIENASKDIVDSICGLVSP